MASFSRFYQNVIINTLLRGEPFTPPTEVFMGLLLSTPTAIRPGAEVANVDYVRQPMEIADAVDGRVELSKEVRFPRAEQPWGRIEAVAIYDAEEDGEMLVWSAIAEPKPIGTGDAFSVPVGMLRMWFGETVPNDPRGGSTRAAVRSKGE
jgi:hypothetical protein